MWPLCDADGLNGNHELFYGARNYFRTVLSAFNRGASYFKLETGNWKLKIGSFFGLDTGYTVTVAFTLS
jgi:hypothetical protein